MYFKFFVVVFNDVVDQAIKICPLFADFEFGRLENEDKVSSEPLWPNTQR